ncbi:MAG TPA: 50S ribosomal protein L15 [bacterium]|nr:50S ribosomal protein L15 [bacterium]HPN30684.1 50S ribosomal protein L15 [bacterium]
MRLNDLKPAAGSKRKKKIVGRGVGSRGAFSGKGMNGQLARSGGGKNASFEGGQMPLHRRLPKRGFNNFLFRTEYSVINICDIERFNVEKVDIDYLKSVGYLSNKKAKVKLLGKGEVSKPVKVIVHKASASAIEKIKKAGGSVEALEKL